MNEDQARALTVGEIANRYNYHPDGGVRRLAAEFESIDDLKDHINELEAQVEELEERDCEECSSKEDDLDAISGLLQAIIDDPATVLSLALRAKVQRWIDNR